MPTCCPNCQREASPSAAFCEECGTNLSPSPTPGPPPTATNLAPAATTAVKHDVPKCLACGAITPWKVEPALLPRHIVVGGALLLLCGSGLIYWLTVALARGNPKTRAKICPRCGGRNMWTFLY